MSVSPSSAEHESHFTSNKPKLTHSPVPDDFTAVQLSLWECGTFRICLEAGSHVGGQADAAKR